MAITTDTRRETGPAPTRVPTPRTGAELRLTVRCPTLGCDGRVGFDARKFRGAPMTATCKSCRTGYVLCGGVLSAAGHDRVGRPAATA